MHLLIIFTLFTANFLTAKVTQNNAPTATTIPQHKKHHNNPLVITIHSKEKQISSVHQCHNGSPQDTCECCLLQVHSSSDNNTQSLDGVVTTCIEEQKLCTEQSIQDLKQEKGLNGTDSLDDLFKELYSDAVVRPMYVDNAFIDRNGKFTEKTLPDFFAQAYAEKKLFDPALSRPECINVKNIAQKKSGKKTVQLFLVTSTCSQGSAKTYIVKEASNGITEAHNLKSIEKLETIQQCIAPHVAPGLPTLALPIAYFSYPSANTVHYLATMPAAKGRTIKGLVKQYQTDKTPQNKHTLERAFYTFGKETANFHKLNMEKVPGKILGPTVIHEDLHIANAFFDSIKNHTIWIDNETMAHSIIRKKSPVLDFDKALIVGKQKNISQAEWYDLALRSFVTGYAETYPKNQQAQVVQEIKDLLYHHKTRKKGVYYDLKDIKDAYINPVFDQLIEKMSH